jgi:hypothetical protein
MFVSVAGARRRDSRAFCSCDYLIGGVKRVWLFLALGTSRPIDLHLQIDITNLLVYRIYIFDLLCFLL